MHNTEILFMLKQSSFPDLLFLEINYLKLCEDMYQELILMVAVYITQLHL